MYYNIRFFIIVGECMDYLVKRKHIASELINKVAYDNDISNDLAEILCMRDITDSGEIVKFLSPNIADLTPVFNYNGMEQAADRIKQAILRGEVILIYGDYDCDGVCASSILYLFLQSLGADVRYFVPHRKKDGYGLSNKTIEHVAEEYLPDLIITVDCGISSHEEILYGINELGLEFIVTDHHEPPEILPECITIDPKIAMSDDTFNELCGAGIALRLCEAIGGEKALMYYIDLACIATIADIVPLIGDNRIIVSYGMMIINARARMSTKLLLESANIAEGTSATSTDIAFRIVPKINAIGRLSDPMKAVAMLTDPDYFFVKHLVEGATTNNTDRQQFTEDLVADVLVMLEDFDLVCNKIIVLYSDKWEAGVLGIACSKLVSIFKRPVILMTELGGVYKGSCRSVDGINMHDCLVATSNFLASYGGHKMACGLSVAKEDLEGFVFAINEYVRNTSNDIYLPYITYDLEKSESQVSLNMTDELSTLEPFGCANPAPNYKISNWSSDFNRITTTKHAKSKYSDEFELVYFGGYSIMSALNEAECKHAVAELSGKIFNNRKYVQGLVKSIQLDMSNYIGDEDYLAVKYVYNAKYDDSTIFKIEYVDEKSVKSISKNPLFGTLYVASQPSTYNKYIKILDGVTVREDIRNLSEENPYNRIILDIDISSNIVHYRDIVFLDEPITRGVIDYYKLNKDARVHFVSDSKWVDGIDIVRKSFPDTAGMRDVFGSVKALLAKYMKVTNLAELYDLYKKKHGDNVIKFYIAMFVFFELRIIRVKGGFLQVDPTVRTSLESSTIYTKIREVTNG